ncbi:Uncharacterized protein APZ42_016179 [Daphnia magna]|uniref:Uncharacterized protein n=1 Tax=Daphnia magna TaxID=35525 RepID=A0A162NNN7_9CRUS|nr:Uncharacterized protein APZ42_016179 [Daphnia magna]
MSMVAHLVLGVPQALRIKSCTCRQKSLDINDVSTFILGSSRKQHISCFIDDQHECHHHNTSICWNENNLLLSHRQPDQLSA